MAEATSDDKARKIRSLLASYYDDEEGADDQSLLSPASTSSISPNRRRNAARSLSPVLGKADGSPAPGPMDVSYFDADSYLRSLVRETRLGDLAGRHRALVGDVAALDSDMQMLVYENYNKFIAATDLIRQMNGEMAGLDDRIRTLEGLLSGVVERSYSVNGKLEAGQQTIAGLNQARVMLHKVQALQDVPRKLRAAMNSGALDVAADTYAEAAPVLVRHGQRPALRAVAAEVEELRSQVASRLRRQLLTQPEGAAESIQLIARLGEPTESLQDAFLASQRDRLEGALQVAEEATREMRSPDDLHPVLVRLHSELISELARTAALFGELFDPAGRPRLIKEMREVMQRYLGLVRSALAQAATFAAAAAAGIDGNSQLLRQHAPGGAAAAGTAAADDLGEDWGTAGVLRALGVVRGDLPRLESPLPELSARDKASELVGNAVRHHVGACFGALEGRVAAEVQALRRQLAVQGSQRALQSSMASGLRSLQAVLLAGAERVVAALRQYGWQAWALEGWRDVFVSLVEAQLDSLALSLAKQFLAEAGGAGTPLTPGRTGGGSGREGASRKQAQQLPRGKQRPPPPGLLLVLCELCSFMARQVLVHGHAQIEQMKLDRLQYGGGRSDGHTSAEGQRQLGAAAVELVHGYVAARGGALAAQMEEAVQSLDWATHPDVQGPRASCHALLEQLAAVDGEVAAVEGACEPEVSYGGSHHSRQSTGSASLEGAYGVAGGGGGAAAGPASMQQQQQDKLDAALLPRLPLARADICALIVVQALRAETAALRSQSLGRAGFQQVQLDCHFLRLHLHRAVAPGVEGAAALASLEEVLVVAAERCTDGAVLLEPVVLDRLITDAQRRKG